MIHNNLADGNKIKIHLRENPDINEAAEAFQNAYQAELDEFLSRNGYSIYDHRSRTLLCVFGVVTIKIARIYLPTQDKSVRKKPDTFLASFIMPGKRLLVSDLEYFEEKMEKEESPVHSVNPEVISGMCLLDSSSLYRLKAWCKKNKSLVRILLGKQAAPKTPFQYGRIKICFI